MHDAYGRDINYIRISITDKCNLRCRYCMPEGIDILPMSSLLSLEEIVAVCRQASLLGIDRIKVTGGEPLVRRGVTELVGMLKALPGIRQVTMTTNGTLLTRYLPDLIRSGLDGINISLDTLDRDRYRYITGTDQLEEVLSGIEEAAASRIPVKINSVLMRGVNDKDWRSLISLAEKRPVDVRFIEMMPIGAGSRYDSIANTDLYELIKGEYPDIVEDGTVHGNGPAVYYRIPGYIGSIGFISAMHGKFCSACNRIRMTAVGGLKPCLCYDSSVNIRDILRNQGEEAVAEVLKQVIYRKPRAHCFEHQDEITEKKKMIEIGG